MKNWAILLVIAGMLLACSKNDGDSAMAPAGMADKPAGVTITAPADQSEINGNSVTVTYEVNPSPSGDHIHIYVDDRKPDILRKLKGSYEVTDLAPGEHTITVKEVNAGHTPTGHEAVLHITTG